MDRQGGALLKRNHIPYTSLRNNTKSNYTVPANRVGDDSIRSDTKQHGWMGECMTHVLPRTWLFLRSGGSSECPTPLIVFAKQFDGRKSIDLR